MFYNNDRNKIRQFYFDTWQKHLSQQALTPLESQILSVILSHPEYQAMLTPEQQGKDFSEQVGQTNPFMHMGLHLALRDQVQLDQPQGIKALFENQLAKGRDVHDIEHQFMSVLSEQMWQATQENSPLDMQSYLEALKLI